MYEHAQCRPLAKKVTRRSRVARSDLRRQDVVRQTDELMWTKYAISRRLRSAVVRVARYSACNNLRCGTNSTDFTATTVQNFTYRETLFSFFHSSRGSISQARAYFTRVRMDKGRLCNVKKENVQHQMCTLGVKQGTAECLVIA